MRTVSDCGHRIRAAHGQSAATRPVLRLDADTHLSNHVHVSARLLELIQGLINSDPQIRADGADAVTDHPQELDGVTVDAVASVLLALRVHELDPRAGEAQLHALADLAEWHVLPSSVLHNLDKIPAATITGSVAEHLEDLRSLALGRDPTRREPPTR